jgi:hypothetical protein
MKIKMEHSKSKSTDKSMKPNSFLYPDYVRDKGRFWKRGKGKCLNNLFLLFLKGGETGQQ